MRPGKRTRWDRTPEDMARSIERERGRFVGNIMIDPRPWTIARSLSGHVDDGGGEGLRGVYEADAGPAGRLTWWNSWHASHHQGRLMLGIGPDAAVLEVEINVDADGTLYAGWRDEPAGLVDRFLAHPTMTFVDGCLSSGGRRLQIRGCRVRMLDGEVEAASTPEDVRRPLWEEIARLARRWAATRRPTMPDGSPVPPMASVRPFRLYVEEQLAWRASGPVPRVSVDDDGTIVAIWRATGSVATIRFADGEARTRVNLDGRVTETGPHVWKSQRHIRLLDLHMALVRFRSAEDEG